MTSNPESKTNTILITGFEPFGGASVNPAWEAVHRLPQSAGSSRLVTCQVPVVYGKCAETVLAAVRACSPSAVILVGQAGGRSDVTPERIAINLACAGSADNAGTVLKNVPLIPGGPNAYFDTLDAFGMTETLKAEGYRISLSYSAGAYVCNNLFYSVSHALAETDVKVGFIHVPFLPQQAAENVPSMELSEITGTLYRCCQYIDARL